MGFGSALKKYSQVKLSKDVRRIKKKLVQFDPEKKQVMYSSSGASFPTLGSITLLSNVGAGDGVSQRDGHQIVPRYLILRMNLAHDSTVNVSACRVMIFQDKQQVGDSTPGVSTLLYDNTGNLGTISPLSELTKTRFKVLKDSTMLMDYYNRTKQITWKIKLSGYIEYNGNATTDIQKNGIYMLVISDQPTYVPVATSWSYQFCFSDK